MANQPGPGQRGLLGAALVPQSQRLWWELRDEFERQTLGLPFLLQPSRPANPLSTTASKRAPAGALASPAGCPTRAADPKTLRTCLNLQPFLHEPLPLSRSRFSRRPAGLPRPPENPLAALRAGGLAGFRFNRRRQRRHPPLVDATPHQARCAVPRGESGRRGKIARARRRGCQPEQRCGLPGRQRVA